MKEMAEDYLIAEERRWQGPHEIGAVRVRHWRWHVVADFILMYVDPHILERITNPVAGDTDFTKKIYKSKIF